LVKVRETFTRDRETALKTNAFWQSTLVRHASEGNRSASIADADTVLSLLTPPVMQRLIVQYFPLDNYVKGTLLPEK
jgi:hypothetical protein